MTTLFPTLPLHDWDLRLNAWIINFHSFIGFWMGRRNCTFTMAWQEQDIWLFSQRCYISAVEVKNGLMHNSISNKIRHESPFLLNKIRQESPFRSLECKPVRRGMIGQIDFRPAVLGNWFGRMRGGWYDIESYSTSIKITITPNV